MIRRLAVLAVIALAGCFGPSSEEAFAPNVEFGAEIAQCRERNWCEQLCMSVFSVSQDSIAQCTITRMVPDGAYVRVHYYSDDGGIDFGWDDGGDYPDSGGGGYEDESPSDDVPTEDDDDDGYEDEEETDDDDGYDGEEP